MTDLASKQPRTGRRSGNYRIGTSGFHYKHWKGIFYPENLSSKQWFAYYASQFDTVELNNTFYRLPPETYFDAWRAGAPDGFCFALKFSRYGSHVMKLKNAGDTIRRFTERAERLADHLAPILVQLPPRWDVNVERLADFLAAAPRRHRWTVEFRDPRWLINDDATLGVYAREIEGYLKSGLDAYVYFNNDLHGHALKNAATLKALLQKETQRS
ncbi:MAG: hypothetical protein K0Q83_3500 [Deltaproteobacteria bacterium]|nr:hypothetical protein [Deltaproteobacteria bacterium]